MGLYSILLCFGSSSQGHKYPPFSLLFPFLGQSDSVGFVLGLVVDSCVGDPNLWVDIVLPSLEVEPPLGGIWIYFHKVSGPPLQEQVFLGGISRLTVAVTFVK